MNDQAPFPDSSDMPSSSPIPALNVSDAPAAGPSTKRRWVTVAAATIGAVAIGVGGYALGTGHNSAPTAATNLPAPVGQNVANVAPGNVQPPKADFGAPGRNLGGGLASAEGRSGSPVSADSKMMYGPMGRIVFTAGSGLSTTPGTGQAWTFDPASVFAKETAERIAATLGVKGEARKEWGGWTVGPIDGSGPSVSLSPDGTASISFYDPSVDPWNCPTIMPMPIEPGAGDSADGSETAAVEPAVEPTCTQRNVEDAAQGDAAVAKAKEVIASLGIDVSTLTFTAQDSGDTKTSYISADLTIAGAYSGVAWGVSFVGDDLQSVYGPMAPVVALGDYAVISAADAVARLTDPRFGASFSGGPIMYAQVREGVSAAAPDQPAEPTVPAPIAPGSPIAWPVSQVTITSAELGTTTQYQPDGSTLIIPAYILSSDDGSQWTVNAVADSALDFTAGS